MRKNLLVAYSMCSTHVPTTMDYLRMLGTHLDYDVHYVHVTHDAVMDFDLSEYDAVFNSYCARHCFDGYVSASYCEALKRFAGPKVIAVQDEYDETDRLKEAIATLGFDVVLTCVPEASLEYVYPKADFPDVEFLTVFTGYVSDALVQSHPNPKPLSERSRFIGYRGRESAVVGDLAMTIRSRRAYEARV